MKNRRDLVRALLGADIDSRGEDEISVSALVRMGYTLGDLSELLPELAVPTINRWFSATVTHTPAVGSNPGIHLLSGPNGIWLMNFNATIGSVNALMLQIVATGSETLTTGALVVPVVSFGDQSLVQHSALHVAEAIVAAPTFPLYRRNPLPNDYQWPPVTTKGLFIEPNRTLEAIGVAPTTLIEADLDWKERAAP